MKRGPFGGSLTHSYWFVRLDHGIAYTAPWEERAKAKREWRAAFPFLRERLERAGFSASRDFRFPDNDRAARAKALQEAEDYVTIVYGHTGVRLTITEGSYL